MIMSNIIVDLNNCIIITNKPNNNNQLNKKLLNKMNKNKHNNNCLVLSIIKKKISFNIIDD